MKKETKTTHKVLLRFTEKEYARVKNNVRKSRLFTQSYFRMLIKGIRPTEKPGDDFYKLQNSLRKIRINICQITFKASMLKMHEAKAMWIAEQSFNDHCIKIQNLMLRIDQS